ncbi:hypothetical protein [Saccharibacillus deserti]|uniref:hypothetical protein n=1 Tax=Saccharibacillus deserti TaxID=1634444 RepID=UPI00155772A6|nr:hypothetical protein [Saccharibacillus deserti]
MYYWQVRKYPPLVKGEDIKPKSQTWTSIVDIGKVYDGNKFTEEEYLKAENKYVESVKLFMNNLDIKDLEMMLLGKISEPLFLEHTKRYPKCYSDDLIHFFYTIKEDIILSGSDVEHAIRLSLREDISSQLRRENLFFVNCTYDLYMDIGSEKKEENLIKKIEELGLYADLWTYEYQDNLWDQVND